MKYKNTPTRMDGQPWRCKADGERFASTAEWRRWMQLQLLIKGKQIEGIRRQPSFPLVVNGKKVCTYIGDFYYREKGQEVVEDVKGVETATFRVKAKLFRALHPRIELRVVKA